MRVERARDDPRVRRYVRTAGAVAGFADDPCADVRIGADQEIRVEVLKHDRTGPIEARPRTYAGRRAPHGLERFLERQHEPHRPSSFEGEERHQRLKLRPALAAEAAPGIRRDDPNARERLVLTLRSEEHTSELQSPYDLVCRLLL